VFWVYLAGAALVAAGFADFPLIAFHFQQARTVSAPIVPVFYAIAMAVSGTGSLIFGRLYDRVGIGVLVPLTIGAAAYAPLVFLGGVWAAVAGMALWGLGMGVQESIIPAAVAPMVAPGRRASAYGLFTGAYGTAWVLGSVVIGVLFDVSLGAVTAFCLAAQLAAIPLLVAVRRRAVRPGHPDRPAAGQPGGQ
jgi:predicted MFS family arabinose efflux permease